jgi:hypothetical protein
MREPWSHQYLSQRPSYICNQADDDGLLSPESSQPDSDATRRVERPQHAPTIHLIGRPSPVKSLGKRIDAEHVPRPGVKIDK